MPFVIDTTATIGVIEAGRLWVRGRYEAPGRRSASGVEGFIEGSIGIKVLNVGKMGAGG